MPILRQKLTPPPAWSGARPRGRVLALLDEALAQGSHVGVFAGSGCGKTMLLSEWARSSRERRVAWLTLDAEDADLDVFLAYLIAAFESAIPGFATEASELLPRAREREGAQAALSALLADLDEQCDSPIVLVLDDYHLPASPSLDALLTRMLRYLSPLIRLVIAARKQPEIDLAMLQATRVMRVLDEQALVFTREELRAAWPDRPEADVDELLRTTGGWPAALGMTQELLEAFLDEQMLARLPEDVQRFLQRASLVESFDATLCEEALGEPLTRARRELLLRERLIVLRGDRYVMHPVLRHLLQRRFASDVGREERLALLRAVGEHHWRQGQPATALRFWIEAGDSARAVASLEEAAEGWLAVGRAEALSTALQALGPAAETPALQVARGELHRRWGEYQRAEAAYEEAEAAGATGALLGRARLGRAQLAASRGDAAGARERLADIAPLVEPNTTLALDLDILNGGLALLAGETERAIAHYQTALALGRTLGDPYAQARATHNLGICYIRQGDFPRALETYELAMGLTAADGTPLVWMAPVNRALVLVHMGSASAGVEAANAALGLVRRYRLTREEGYALRILGYAQRMHGDFDAAAAAFKAAEHLARGSGDALGLAYSLNFQAELAQERGDVPSALALIEEVEAVMGGGEATRGVLELAQVRAKVLLAAGRREEAKLLLDELGEQARLRGYGHLARDVEHMAGDLAAPAAPARQATRGPSEHELVIQCFGGPRVMRAGREITDREWQTARTKQLLAFLVFTPAGATKQHLLTSVFGDEEISNDLMNITMMRLRKALEPELEKGKASRFIQRVDGRYVLDRQASVTIDTDVFDAALAEARPDAPDEREALERAVACYRADLLPDYEVPWAVALRMRYQARALVAFKRLVQLYDEQSPELVHALLHRALQVDPLDEELNRELILRHLEAGEPHLALRQYELCERWYREVLDRSPPADLAALVSPL